MKMTDAQLDSMHRALFPSNYDDERTSPTSPRGEGVSLDELNADELRALDEMYSMEMSTAADGTPKLLLSNAERAIAASRLRDREAREWRRQKVDADRALAEAPRRELLALRREAEDSGQRLRRVAERDRILCEMSVDQRRALEKAGAFSGDLADLDRALNLETLPPTAEQMLDEMHRDLMGGSTSAQDGRIEMAEHNTDHNSLNL